jgi:hypothetical protein
MTALALSSPPFPEYKGTEKRAKQQSDILPRLVSTTWRHLSRVIGGNLRSIEVTPREKARLDKAGLSEDTLQRYAVWRRSVLFAVIGPTLLSAVLATADTVTQGMTGLSPLGKFLTVVSTLILYTLPVSAVAALLDWTHLKRSHRWLLWGWILAFLPPFVLALFPQGWWFTPSDVPEQRAAERLEWAVLDVLKGIYFYCTLMPAVLSLLPGMIRACLRLKTLLPTSVVFGWCLVAGAPFYLLVWWVALIALNHLAGDPLLVAGVLLWIGAPMVYVLRSELFIRPISASECGEVDRLRRLSGLVTVVALFLLLAYVMTKKVFGFHLIGLEEETSLLSLLQNETADPESIAATLHHATSLVWIGELNVYQLVVEYFSRSLFVTVVFADLLLRINLSVWQHETRFRETEAAAEYDATMSTIAGLFARKAKVEKEHAEGV